jgi:ParB family chromosome partitioning protein
MGKQPERRGLGRGLSALLGEIGGEIGETTLPAAGTHQPEINMPDGRPPATVPIERLRSNPDQPRRDFPETELNELASSIRQRGIIQPVVVRPDPSHLGDYQIVAGERRWRAAQRARLHEIPIVVRELDDRAVLELAIIENVQRSDLNPIEEANGYVQLIERFAYTQEKMSDIVGKSRSHVANTLRALAEQAVLKGLTVRQVEELARRVAAAPRRRVRGGGGPKQKDADTRILEGDLSAAISMAVSIEHHPTDGGGEMRIRYRSLDELDRLCRKLTE